MYHTQQRVHFGSWNFVLAPGRSSAKIAGQVLRGAQASETICINLLSRSGATLPRDEYRDLVQGITNVRYFPQVDGKIILHIGYIG